MCVIIHRPAGIEFPFTKLKNAVLRNQDGFGLVTHLGSGELDIRREWNGIKNDPDFIYSLMQDAKDYPISLHLRFATAGNKSLENCHPFTVMNKKDHGRDILFFHNGTLTPFKDTKSSASDSALFNEKILIPLVTMAVDAYEDEWASSPRLQSVLQHFAGTWNVFSLIDNKDNSLIINRSQGHEEGGWWASNNSYFGSSGYQYTSLSDGEWEEYISETGAKRYTYKKRSSSQSTTTPTTTSTPSTKTVSESPSSSKSSVPSTGPTSRVPWNTEEKKTMTESPLEEEATKLRNFLTKYSSETTCPSNSFVMFESIGRESFRSLADIVSLRELLSLSADEVEELVSEFPMMACCLIMDLLLELYQTPTSKKIEQEVTHVA